MWTGLLDLLVPPRKTQIASRGTLKEEQMAKTIGKKVGKHGTFLELTELENIKNGKTKRN